jgi:hypothetical protein
MSPNLDKHPTRRGEYIAYDAQGFAWRCFRDIGGWRARPSHAAAATDHRMEFSRTLAELARFVGISKRKELPTGETGLRDFA